MMRKLRCYIVLVRKIKFLSTFFFSISNIKTLSCKTNEKPIKFICQSKINVFNLTNESHLFIIIIQPVYQKFKKMVYSSSCFRQEQ